MIFYHIQNLQQEYKAPKSAVWSPKQNLILQYISLEGDFSNYIDTLSGNSYKTWYKNNGVFSQR